jgi:hypothetical protein
MELFAPKRNGTELLVVLDDGRDQIGINKNDSAIHSEPGELRRRQLLVHWHKCRGRLAG